MKLLPLLVLTIAYVKGQPAKPSKLVKSPDVKVEDYLHDLSLSIKTLRDKFKKDFEKDHVLNKIDINHLHPDINNNLGLDDKKRKNRVEKKHKKNEKKKNIEEINLSHGILSDMKLREGNKREAVAIWKDSFGKPHIPYVINTDGGNNFNQEINNAINAMNSYMSVCGQKVWVLRTNEEDYVEIITSQEGCWSDVGRKGGKQQINIGKGCEYKGTILHEMLHTMGFDHEHNRCDRDQFVEIVWDNIAGTNNDQFLINSNPQFYPTYYDIFSVMHYGLWSFSINSTKEENFKTIKVRSQYMILSPAIEAVIGEVNDMSKSDKEDVNVLYGCKAPSCLVTCEGFSNCTALTGDEPSVTTEAPEVLFKKADESFGNKGSPAKVFQAGDEPSVTTEVPEVLFKKADESFGNKGPPGTLNKRKREGLELAKELDNLLRRFKDYIGRTKDES